MVEVVFGVKVREKMSGNVGRLVLAWAMKKEAEEEEEEEEEDIASDVRYDY